MKDLTIVLREIYNEKGYSSFEKLMGAIYQIHPQGEIDRDLDTVFWKWAVVLKVGPGFHVYFDDKRAYNVSMNHEFINMFLEDLSRRALATVEDAEKRYGAKIRNRN